MNKLWDYPIWQLKTDFDKKFNQSILDEIYDIAQEVKKDPNPKDSLWDYRRPQLSILKTAFSVYVNNTIVRDIPEILDLNYQFNCDMGWVNVREPGQDIELHSHPDSSWAATYYVKTPENCGDLICHVGGGKKIKIKPEEGMIVVLPFYMLHEMEFNCSNDLRVSISTDFTQIVDKSADNALVIKSWCDDMLKVRNWNSAN
jgi:hypothetical protein